MNNYLKHLFIDIFINFYCHDVNYIKFKHIILLYIIILYALMSELKTNISDSELRDIKTPNVIYVMKTIKAIQTRMKDPDVVDLPYIRVYDKLGKEFSEFFDSHTKIFTTVIRGENLNTITAVLYYKDKVARGLMTEEQLMEILMNKFLPPDLREEAKGNIKKMRADGIV